MDMLQLLELLYFAAVVCVGAFMVVVAVRLANASAECEAVRAFAIGYATEHSAMLGRMDKELDTTQRLAMTCAAVFVDYSEAFTDDGR